MVRSCILSAISVSVLIFVSSDVALAQSACDISSLSNPPRQSITCSTALSVEREPAAEVTLIERPGAAPPRVLELENGAILITVEPGSPPTQIRTPHAIAAVRGTIYIVDAGPDQTSVFVIEGRVEVRKLNDSARIIQLTAGKGVDVSAGEPLQSRTWPAPRVSEVLSRFGR